MTITLENKHLALGAASLLATFQLYRTFSSIFANTKPTKHTNGFSVQVERGLGSLDPDSELGKGVNEVYPPDAFEGGSDVRLPNGRVKYYLLGPEEGDKVGLSGSNVHSNSNHHSRSFSCMDLAVHVSFGANLGQVSLMLVSEC